MTKAVLSSLDVHDAANRIVGVALRTPLIEFPALNARAGHRVLVKFEGAQRTGSFKFRGAYNRLAHMSEKEKTNGVVAWSGGNHAQGVAAAARLLNMAATIVMPMDAPTNKIMKTHALGAKIVRYDRCTQSRETIADAIASENGAVLVPSFDDPYIIAGQGTVALEILEQARVTGTTVTRIFAPCGGGGLVAGIALAVIGVTPSIAVYSVEPAMFDDTARSLVSGRHERVEGNARSICDALLAPTPGELTFQINQASLAGGLIVTDSQVRAAMRFAFGELKLVIEPSGAVALAAVLERSGPPTDGVTAVVISGSNVDSGLFADIIRS